jgi:hypothetical protein
MKTTRPPFADCYFYIRNDSVVDMWTSNPFVHSTLRDISFCLQSLYLSLLIISRAIFLPALADTFFCPVFFGLPCLAPLVLLLLLLLLLSSLPLIDFSAFLIPLGLHWSTSRVATTEERKTQGTNRQTDGAH